MKPATITELKKELKYRSQEQLIDYCLAMARFKLETKELLTYLVFESENETAYIESVKAYIDATFSEISATNYYYIKKAVRKILRQVKRFIRYSKKKETEAELLIYFCKRLGKMQPSYKQNTVLTNMYNKQLELAQKAIAKVHEDLQYDYNVMIEEL
ncbi:hypothetical protein [Pontimicrobium aquaticum]|uniref:Uncharacterized protein n=1 Tax=Pontimicrobium aquaticum TaxID=2565367 RepID=A0A4U0EQV3_9FLAO|nr:hypothetical protein [Pontimicrobium aquaticum]TJY34086.1 hypothetical protein E5167_12280 [Pontimicrobium aquaticum]